MLQIYNSEPEFITSIFENSVISNVVTNSYGFLSVNQTGYHSSTAIL